MDHSGVERLQLVGAGAIRAVTYRLAHGAKPWTLVKHLCLPVFDADYQCSPTATGNEDAEARSRVPPRVQHNGIGTVRLFTTCFPLFALLRCARCLRRSAVRPKAAVPR